MSAQPSRGALIVVEGLDRSGKSSQCELLVKALSSHTGGSRYVKFPGKPFLARIHFVAHGFRDRSTLTGAMINSYLTGSTQQDDHSIHLLFSANRWEAISAIRESINNGVHVVVDRFSFSGAVYSAAKANPDLDLQWGTSNIALDPNFVH
jgi:dTMP kinase